MKVKILSLILLILSISVNAQIWAGDGEPDEQTIRAINLGQALINAAANGNLERVKYLVINTSVDINYATFLLTYPSTALSCAIEIDNLEMVKFLVNNGANVNPNSGCPPLISALEEEYPRYKYFEIVKFLVNNGANVNVVYKNSTPLTLAVRGGNLEIVKFLVDNQADINMAGYGRKTPISIAKERGWRDIISYLRTKGASE